MYYVYLMYCIYILYICHSTHGWNTMNQAAIPVRQSQLCLCGCPAGRSKQMCASFVLCVTDVFPSIQHCSGWISLGERWETPWTGCQFILTAQSLRKKTHTGRLCEHSRGADACQKNHCPAPVRHKKNYRDIVMSVIVIVFVYKLLHDLITFGYFWCVGIVNKQPMISMWRIINGGAG